MTTKEIFLRELDNLEKLILGDKSYPTETYLEFIEDLRAYFESLKVVRIKER